MLLSKQKTEMNEKQQQKEVFFYLFSRKSFRLDAIFVFKV